MDLDEFSQRLLWIESRLGKLRPAPGGEERDPRFMWEEAAETLSVTAEELRVAEEELRQQGEELEQSQFRAEEERRRYHRLFEMAPVAYLVTNMAGVVREANRAAGALLGIDPHRLEGKPLANYITMDDRATFRSGLAHLAGTEAGSSAEWTLRVKPRHGGPFEATLMVSVDRDWSGEATSARWAIRPRPGMAHLAGTSVPEGPGRLKAAWLEGFPAPDPGPADVEARRLRALLDGIDAVAWEADPETLALHFIGRGIEVLLGYPASRWLGEPGLWAELLHPDDRSVASAWRERCLSDGPGGSFEYRLMAADGHAVWVFESIAVERDERGGARAVRGVIHDIGRRKKAERRLYAARRELADRLADVSYFDELTGRLVGLLDPARVASEALTAVAAVVGAELGVVRLRAGEALEVAAAIGLDADYVERYGRVAIGEGPCGLAVAGGGPMVVEDLWERPTDERSADAALTGGYRGAFSVPLRGGDGELLGTVATFFRDTHRPPGRQVRLVERYAVRAAAALEAARRHAEALEADRRKDELLATLAHELRTPLAAIHDTAQALRPDDDGPTAEEARAVIVRQARYMARLVEDLLDASRIGRGALVLRRERVDAAWVAARALEDTRPIVLARGHELSVALPEGPAHLDADPIRLEQVLVNLLTNAARYTEPGGRIGLEVRREGDAIVFRVRDSGIGLEPGARGRIFALFAQDRSEAGPGGGLGIGLAVVKTVVELHGGTVDVASDGPGQGCEFVVRLPVGEGAPADPDRPAGRAEETPSDGPGLRLLVVDDEPDSARALARLLRFWGHDVRVAHDARSALDEARRHRPGLVLLDLGLPGVDGFEVARRLREEAGNPRLVALTGHSREPDRLRAAELGFAAYLVKPVDPAELGRLLGENSGEGA